MPCKNRDHLGGRFRSLRPYASLIIIKEPRKMSAEPRKKYRFKFVLKKRKLNKITKKGYAISRIAAVEAPRDFIPEKMKKFANAAKITERKIRPRLSPPEFNNILTDGLSNKSIGRVITAKSNELVASNAKGETLSRTLWSIVYTRPHVIAAVIAYINPIIRIVLIITQYGKSKTCCTQCELKEAPPTRLSPSPKETLNPNSRPHLLT